MMAGAGAVSPPLRLLIGVVLLLMPFMGVALAQDAGDDPQAVIASLLGLINEQRRRNEVPFVFPNETLTSVANIYLQDYLARDVENLGDIFLLADGQTNLESLVEERGYRAYSNGYFIDLLPIITVTPPDQLLNFILTDAREGRAIRSRRMVQLAAESQLPLFRNLFREVGMAYQFNLSNERHYYVLVFGSQPGVLPIGLADPESPATLITRTDAPMLDLRLTNESSYTTGDQVGEEEFLGRVRLVRLSDQPTPQACPELNAVPPDVWQDYQNKLDYALAPAPGPQTLYVQFCDALGRTTVSAVSVEYVPGGLVSPAAVNPVVMQAVSATQTAAAAATAVAPFQPTVEFILTATAEAGG
jgi:hypothetical protein